MNRFIKRALAFALAATVLSGCSMPADKAKREYDEEKIDMNVVEGMSSFAFDVFRELNNAENGGNVFISPLSISTALTMTYNGSRGGTREAMGTALGYEGKGDGMVNASFGNLLPYLMQVDEDVELDISNSIWYRAGEAIEVDFLEKNSETFDARVEEMDFTKEDAADSINGWISDSTRGKIDKMIDPPISPDVVMYLINAVYFKGDWSVPFDEDRTYETLFTEASGEQKAVEMMSMKAEAMFGETGDFKVVRLPYGNGKLSMHVVLPEGGKAIDDLIESLDAEYWQEIKGSLEETQDLILGIPKFKMTYGIKNLNRILMALGMEEAFGPEADFSGIREDLFISRVLHKAVIEVNEKGSEAAAATVVEMMESAMEEPDMFIADRPFIFLIADDVHESILFMGKYGSVE